MTSGPATRFLASSRNRARRPCARFGGLWRRHMNTGWSTTVAVGLSAMWCSRAVADFLNLSDGRRALASVSMTDGATGQQFGGTDEKSPPDQGAWDATAHYELTTAIGSGFCTARLQSEALSA